jgi:hypothetical protein
MSAESEYATKSTIENQILESIRSLRFGTVEVVVHEGKVVQIDRKEKVRVNGQT